MASYVFENAKKLLSMGQLNFVSGGPYRLALMTADIQTVSTFSKLDKWSEISQFEISQVSPTPVGYTPKMLSGVGVSTVDTNSDGSDDSVVYANNVSYNVSTITASYIVIVKAKTSGDVMTDNDELICALDIRSGGLPVTSNAGVFKIRLDISSGGFLIIK